MYQPKFTPISALNSTLHCDQAWSQSRLPACFNVLTWNLHKIDFSHFTHRPIESLLPIEPPHILSLQEATIIHSASASHRFFDLPFVMAPNLQTAKRQAGVLTASSSFLRGQQQCLTQSRELGFLTHKTALITHHTLACGQNLIHVNIHAINFVSHRVFAHELQQLWNHLAHSTQALIISGDFNTWNPTRLKTLLNATQQLNLSQVAYPDTRPIKTLMRQPLDHIFYRGLQLTSAQALNVPSLSDHNPLIAQFCQP
ncbi:endonuclease/exonuclease/phosphatase family protein [Thiomicrorhabdus aquaedulcis]|uniref:endonuclease/exonuclease/phosphatase family protein n=1 Tax=Thiomicrorhabdus aquaedulcis TaxID=2211106 RepID=UPI000FD772F7|nr:endonuclease/exonuclease/phosphatase family protein [Thiomicrorhabdus aquaedulcis]